MDPVQQKPNNKKILENPPQTFRPFDLYRYSTILSVWLTNHHSEHYTIGMHGRDPTIRYKEAIWERKQEVQTLLRETEGSTQPVSNYAAPFYLDSLVDHDDFNLNGYQHENDNRYCKTMITLFADCEKWIQDKDFLTLENEGVRNHIESSLANIRDTINCIKFEGSKSPRAHLLRDLNTMLSKGEKSLIAIETKKIDSLEQAYNLEISKITKQTELNGNVRMAALSNLWQNLANFETTIPAMQNKSDAFKASVEKKIQDALLSEISGVLELAIEQSKDNNTAHRAFNGLKKEISYFISQPSPSPKHYEQLRKKINNCFSGEMPSYTPDNLIAYLLYIWEQIMLKIKASQNLSSTPDPVTFSKMSMQNKQVTQFLEPRKKKEQDFRF